MSKQVVRHKQSGQALVIIAGALVALMALVALAVDGSNAFAQRRIAQNAVDGAVMAGQSQMAQLFASHRYETPAGPKVWPITGAEDRTIMLASIVKTLEANGADTVDVQHGGTFQAFYLNHDGTRYGVVGAGKPVPFADGDGSGSAGVQGIWVESTVHHETYFARIIGVNQVGSDANSTGKIEGIQGVSDIKSNDLIPFAIYTDETPNLHGDVQLSAGFSRTYNIGSWNLICFRAANAALYRCNESDITTWMGGYNPGRLPATTYGPSYYLEQPNGSYGTYMANESYLPMRNDGDPSHTYATGIWMVTFGPSVTPSSSTLNLINQAISAHRQVLVPIINKPHQTHGQAYLYHVTDFARFQFTGGSTSGTITGRFLGWNWDPSSAKSDPAGLSKAVINGQTVLRLGP